MSFRAWLAGKWDNASAKQRRWTVIVGAAFAVALLGATPPSWSVPINTDAFEGRFGFPQVAHWVFLSSIAYLLGLAAKEVVQSARGHRFKRAENDAAFAIMAFLGPGTEAVLQAIFGLGTTIVDALVRTSLLFMMAVVFLVTLAALGIVVHKGRKS